VGVCGGLWARVRLGGESPIHTLGNRILESNMGGDPIFDGLGGRAWEPRGWGAEPFFVLCFVVLRCVAVCCGRGGEQKIDSPFLLSLLGVNRL